LLQDGCKVSLIGYTGTPLIAPLEEAASKRRQLHVTRVQPWTPWKVLRQTKVLKPFYYLPRSMELIRVLNYALIQMMAGADSDGIDCLLVQNPPSIPSLIISYLFCWLHGSTLIIDWHNLGFTMLTDVKESHWIRKLAYRYELYFSHRADGHLYVTKAMQQFLHQTFILNRPPRLEREARSFKSTTIGLLHSFDRLHPGIYRPEIYLIPYAIETLHHDLRQNDEHLLLTKEMIMDIPEAQRIQKDFEAKFTEKANRATANISALKK
jgi:hypothetical protein